MPLQGAKAPPIAFEPDTRGGVGVEAGGPLVHRGAGGSQAGMEPGADRGAHRRAEQNGITLRQLDRQAGRVGIEARQQRVADMTAGDAKPLGVGPCAPKCSTTCRRPSASATAARQ